MQSTSIAAALLLLSSLAAAQTTHFVENGPGFDFTPADITIQMGDTVTWVWKGGVHTVTSQTGDLPNGIFASVIEGVIGYTFSVTFDSAFVGANPVPNNVYDYYCMIHSQFGQYGTVTVVQSPVVNEYGCLNPAGSLAVVAGAPKVGTTWTVAADNPLATQGAGSLAFLTVASAPAPGYPCGLQLPGFGMAGSGAVGELLVDLAPPNPLVTAGPVTYLGTPASFPLSIPQLPTLVGAQVYVQGLLVDPAPGAAVLFGATRGLAATIGS